MVVGVPALTLEEVATVHAPGVTVAGTSGWLAPPPRRWRPRRNSARREVITSSLARRLARREAIVLDIVARVSRSARVATARLAIASAVSAW